MANFIFNEARVAICWGISTGNSQQTAHYGMVKMRLFHVLQKYTESKRHKRNLWRERTKIPELLSLTQFIKYYLWQTLSSPNFTSRPSSTTHDLDGPAHDWAYCHRLRWMVITIIILVILSYVVSHQEPIRNNDFLFFVLRIPNNICSKCSLPV
jgi:hypothetical protein